MKKLILSVTAVSALTLSASAQQIVFADNSGASYDTTIGGVANTSKDLNLELLEGSTASTVTTPIVTLLLSSSASPTAGQADGGTFSAVSDISFNGYIAEITGSGFVAPAGTAFYQVEAWTGTQYSSYAAALASGTVGVFAGSSAVFQETATTGATAFPADISNVGVIALSQVTAVPEPSTLAMAGVGLASMLIFRRKNK